MEEVTSSNRSGQAAFSTHQDVPFDVWEKLLIHVFESREFKEWLTAEHSWQFRVVGPPGCGKTTLSALTEERIRAWYTGKNVGIACVYFRRHVLEQDTGLVRTLLRSVLSQLASHQAVHAPGLAIEEDHRSSSVEHLADLRAQIRDMVSQLEHAFLLVDDIDLCHEPILGLVEAEFAALQMPKLSIMVTSRVPHIYNTDEATCDIHKGEDIVLVYWFCKNCESVCDPQQDQSPDVVCQSCKDRMKVCSRCGLRDTFYEPYSYVLYKLNYLEDLPQFVARELESAHGDLGLSSEIEDKPPLSTLGRSLEKAKPLLAERIRDNIANRSDNNIALAKARLDFYFNARTVEDVERIGDRLLESMLALFDSAMLQIDNKSFPDRELGLNALIAASIHFNNRPFGELEAWLQTVGLLEIEPEGAETHNLLRTLRATRGLLNVDYGHEQKVQPYSYFLTTYAAENYSEALWSLRHRVDKLRSDSQQNALQEDP